MRRRAGSPHGPVTHDPQPLKRMRRESGGGSQSPPRSANSYSRGGEDTSPRVIRTASPQRPTLPPLHPLPHMQGGPSSSASDRPREAPFQSFGAAGRAAAGSQPPNYSQGGGGGHHPSQSWHAGHRSRHSLDTPHINLKSPSPPPVTKAAEVRATSVQPANASTSTSTSTPTDVVFTRDVTNRQPRSMMACMRCRRQKMKCDGPGNQPCRGCRQAGVNCIFESRTRPKSISTLPSRASPFFGGSMPQPRGGTPGGGPGGFYPPSAQPAAPITSRPAMVPEYGMRPVHPGRGEPMPPQPHPNYPPPLRQHSPPPPGAGGPPPPQYYQGPPPPGTPAYGVPPPAALAAPPAPSAPMDMRMDSRVRSLETAFRSVSTLPAAVAGLQQTLNSLLRTQDALAAQLAGGSAPPAPPTAATLPPRVPTEVPEHVWESYRVGAWPLTPWLPGISPHPGLPAHVLQCLGRRAAVERTEASRREGDTAADAVVAEISRLLGSRVQWTRDEVLSLGVYATWAADPSLGCLAVGLARDLQLDRPHTLRRSHDEWREWIYVVLTDHMVHLPNFDVPMMHDPLASHWRELVNDSRPSDPSTYDRDTKLLSWLEYSELLIEVQAMQRAAEPPTSPKRDSTERDPGRAGSVSSDAALERERQRARDIWHRFAPKWDAWAGSSGARHDPVSSLHLNYAILYTASPVYAASERIWTAVAQSHEGYAQLERARDAAFAVLQTLGSPEIARTIGYSFPVLRPFLGLAIAHIVGMVTRLSHTPIINLPHVQGQLRGVFEMLADAAPLDGSPGSGVASPRSDPDVPQLAPSLLRDMVETGQVAAIGKRDIVGAEPGRDLWRRIVG